MDLMQSWSSLDISLILRSASRSFWLKGKNLVRYFLSTSMLLLSSPFSVSDTSSSLTSQELSSLGLAGRLVNSTLPLCLVLMWVQSAGQLRQDLPQLQEKLRPSSSLRVLRLRLSSTISSELSLSFLEPKLDQLMPLDAIQYIQTNYQSAHFNSNRTVMLAFLGLKVLKAPANKHKYREALQQIRHYLSFKNNIQLHENEYVITLTHASFQMNLVKNHIYLHTNYYNLPLFANQDWELLDVCYQCLMILKESFPSALAIELVTDSQSKQVREFIQKKQQEFNRRVNSNLKAIAQQNKHLDSEQIQQLIYLTAQHYSRKNKSLALKTLLMRVEDNNVANLNQNWLQMLNSLQQPEHKRVISDIIKKIKTFQFEISKNKENRMRTANIVNEKQQPVQPVKPNALIFQLKESYNLDRICSLLTAAINQPENFQLLAKMQKTVMMVTNRFLDSFYEEASLFSSEFCSCIKTYWYKRGKAMNESILDALQRKEKDLNQNSRSKLQSSRQF